MGLTLREALKSEDRFISECLKIRAKNRAIIPLRAKPAQQRVLLAIRRMRQAGKPPRVIIVKARQVGVSTVIEAAMFRRCQFTPHRESIVLAHRVESATKIFQIPKLFYDKQPARLRALYPKLSDSRRRIAWKNGSTLSIEVAGEVRGLTAQDIHFSEFAYYRDPETVFKAAMQAVPDIPDSLVAIESTANGAGLFQDLYWEAKAGKNGFTPIFIAWYDDETYVAEPDFTEDEITAEEQELRARHGLSLAQLAWRRNTIRQKCKGDVGVFRTEYPSDEREAFSASGSPVFEYEVRRAYAIMSQETAQPERSEPEIAKTQANPQGEPRLVTTPEGRCWQYAPARDGGSYFMGIDSAEGIIGGDPSAIVLLNGHTLDVDLVWHGLAKPEVLAWYAYVIGWLYGWAKANPETNNQGLLTTREMQRLGYPNLYRRQKRLEGETRDDSDLVGWYTSPKTRPMLFGAAREYVNSQAGRILHRGLVEELDNPHFETSAWGRVVRTPRGKHDDLICALGLAVIALKGDAEGELRPIQPGSLLPTRTRARIYHRAENRPLPAPMTFDELDAQAELVARSQRRLREHT